MNYKISTLTDKLAPFVKEGYISHNDIVKVVEAMADGDMVEEARRDAMSIGAVMSPSEQAFYKRTGIRF